MRRVLAAIGAFFLRIYYPQMRTTRAEFAREFGLWCLLGLAGWFSLDPIADADWLSDAWFLRVAALVSFASECWQLALFPLLARRLHDAGVSGAWALLAGVPGGVVIMGAACLVLPARRAGLGWPTRAEVLPVVRGQWRIEQ